MQALIPACTRTVQGDCRSGRRRVLPVAPVAVGRDRRGASVSCLVDARAVAEHLGVPVSRVREQTRLGQIPVVELGRYRRYDLERLDAWIDRQVRSRSAIRPGVGSTSLDRAVMASVGGCRVGLRRGIQRRGPRRRPSQRRETDGADERSLHMAAKSPSAAFERVQLDAPFEAMRCVNVSIETI